MNARNKTKSRTRVELSEHEWEIENFSHVNKNLENPLEIRLGQKIVKLILKVCPNGITKTCFVTVGLRKVVDRERRSKLNYTASLALKTADEEEVARSSSTKYSSEFDQVINVHRKELLQRLLPSNLLKVVVTISAVMETVATTGALLPLDSLHTEWRLADDCTKMFTEEMLSDFTIKVGDEEVRAHRAVLAARSPVFRAMFAHEKTNESQTGIMTISDMNEDVVVTMLAYMYSGRCAEDIGEMAADLLIAAEKYELNELKKHCERSLIDQISVDNVCQLLVLADMHRAPKLRKHSINFLTGRRQGMTGTPGWADLLISHPNLVNDIMNGFWTSRAAPSNP